MRGVERRGRSNAGNLSAGVSGHAEAGPGRRGRRRCLRDLSLMIAAVPTPLLMMGAVWTTTNESLLSAGKAKRQGFHFTPLEVQAAVAVFALVTAVYAVRTYYTRLGERRADERATNQLEQARAAQKALVELSEFRSDAVDTNRALTRLRGFRQDNQIAAHRPLRLPRSVFADDDRIANIYQQLQRTFIRACKATLGHIDTMRELGTLAAAHKPDAFSDEVMNAFVQAESLRRIMTDRKIPLEDVENIVAQTIAAIFPAKKDQPQDPIDPSGS
jgi:hypothetical protein